MIKLKSDIQNPYALTGRLEEMRLPNVLEELGSIPGRCTLFYDAAFALFMWR